MKSQNRRPRECSDGGYAKKLILQLSLSEPNRKGDVIGVYAMYRELETMNSFMHCSWVNMLKEWQP
jgi:hypothetical protein